MTRFPQNRTAWTGLALLFLLITPMALVAEEPGFVDPAKMILEQQQAKEKQELERIKQEKRRNLAFFENICAERKNELRMKMDQLRRLSEMLNYNGLSKETQDKLIGSATQSLHETNTGILVKEALVVHLEKSLKKATPPTSLIVSAEAKINLLEKQYRLVQAKKEAQEITFRNASKKETSKAANHITAIQDEIECEQIKAKLTVAELELDTLMEMAKKPIADKIAELQTELVGLKVKEQITKEYLAKLYKSASDNIDIQIMQNDINLLQQQVQELQKQLYKAQMEVQMPITGPTTTNKKTDSGKGK